jgi:hypothetical protein
MSYTTEKEPYIRSIPKADPESLIGFVDEEHRKIETSLSRIHQILEEIEARLTAGGL